MEGKSFWMDEERDGGLGNTRPEIRLGMNIRKELQATTGVPGAGDQDTSRHSTACIIDHESLSHP